MWFSALLSDESQNKFSVLSLPLVMMGVTLSPCQWASVIQMYFFLKVEAAQSSYGMGRVCNRFGTKSSLGGWNAASSWSIEWTVWMGLLGI